MSVDRPLAPTVDAFFDPRTFSVQYIVACPRTGHCAIVDPVRDYDEKSGATATHCADALLEHDARTSSAKASSMARWMAP